MKIYHQILSKPIKFSEHFIQILCIENPKAFREVLLDLKNDENFILSDDKDEYEINKYLSLSVDIFELNFNERKLVNAILKKLSITAKTKFYENSTQVIDNINKFATLLLASYNCELSFNLDIDSLIKSLNIEIEKSKNLLENIIDFMSLQREILGIKVFVFVGLSSIFSCDELMSLYDEIQLKNFNVLLLESNYRVKLKDESVVLIDKDLCEIRY